MEEVIRMTLPLPPRLTNFGKGRSRHWRSLKAEKDQYWRTLDSLQLIGHIPPPPDRPIERAEMRVQMFLWNYMDDSGAMARLKWVEDWLVTRGYLAGDSRKHLRYPGLPDQEIDRRRQRLELEIIPLPKEE